MAMHHMTDQKEASDTTFIVTTHRVSCDGGGGALGHPKVFLEIGSDGQVVCGYCDRRYILKGSKADPARV